MQVKDDVVVTQDDQAGQAQDDATDTTDAAQVDQTATEQEEVVISFGDEQSSEEEKEEAPQWVKELRKKNRELAREKRELEERLKATSTQTAPQLGKKPTLEDFDYDGDKFEEALLEYNDKKRKVEEAAESVKKAEEQQQKEWQERLSSYEVAKKELKVKDYDDAEASVLEDFGITQQGIIVQGTENPAMLVYALGKNDAKRKEIAAIKDPVKFAFAIAKLETQLKVSTRKTPPPPEKVITGTAKTSGASNDSVLERLRAEAEKTGDISKVVAYKRKLKNTVVSQFEIPRAGKYTS